MASSYYRLLLPQAFVGLVDAISYMVVGPSLVFYVSQQGGTYSHYGLCLAVFSLSSFLFKPFLGYWADASGGQFRVPYLTSIAVATLGGLVYFYASFYQGIHAVALIFLGRLLGGVGGANSTLGYTYVALIMPKDQLTKASSALSMVRIVGMATAPSFNYFLDQVDLKVGNVHLEPLNSVGIFLFVGNMLACIVMFLFLQEPPRKADDLSTTDRVCPYSMVQRVKACLLSLEIMVSIVTILTINTNFVLLETTLAPAASDALGFGPIGVSSIFAGNTIIIFLAMVVTIQLASRGVSDGSLLLIGSAFGIVGYGMLWGLWTRGTSVVEFVVPIAIGTLAFPFMGSPNRSIFTRAVDNIPELRDSQGTMQALLSMMASIAGFTMPTIISTFMMRTPDEVEASADGRELKPWALYAPIFSIVSVIGILMIQKSPSVVGDADAAPSETTGLLGDADGAEGEIGAQIRARHRESVVVMGVPLVDLDEQRDVVVSRRHSSVMGATVVAGLGELQQDKHRRKTTIF